jgi:hypothetical protein
MQREEAARQFTINHLQRNSSLKISAYFAPKNLKKWWQELSCHHFLIKTTLNPGLFFNYKSHHSKLIISRLYIL